MAVKQNNTEANGTPPSIGGNGGSAASGNGISNAQNNGLGPGTKIKKINTNTDGSGGAGGGGGGGVVGVGGGVGVASGSNADKPGCSGSDSSGNNKVNSGSGTNGGGGGSGTNTAGIGKVQDIAQILQLIDLLEMKEVDCVRLDMWKIYHQLILQLACVHIPRQSPEGLKRFKDDIARVGEFFAKANDRRIYFLYLRVVCELITSSKSDQTPSCAIAIIFQLFNTEMILDAVRSLLEHDISDQNLRKTVRLLSEWLRICNFCQNLNFWIMAILRGLQDQQKYKLCDEIAYDNIDQLFLSLIVPILRPKVAPIVFHMLTSINQNVEIFHKILPKFSRVVYILKQQMTRVEDQTDETKAILQNIIDLTSALMVRFHGYDELYEAVEVILKDIRQSINYIEYGAEVKIDNSDSSTDMLQYSTNAKVGLVNLGNTCYMNSVLQALAMTKEFSREILMCKTNSPLLIKMQQQIALMLYSIRYELTPSRLLSATRPPGFSPGLQQDSSEFLGYLLETLHEQEVSYNKKGNPLEESDAAEPIAKAPRQNENSVIHGTAVSESSIEGATALDATSEQTISTINDNSNNKSTDDNISSSSTDTINREDFNSTTLQQTNTETSVVTMVSAVVDTAITSPITTTNTNTTTTTTTVTDSSTASSTIEKTFTGKLATIYKCLTCGWKSRIVDSFRDLQLSFPEAKNECASNYSVQDLIDYYCSPEKLDGDNQYFCEQCKKLSDAERYINVITAPKNLILTLKHFKYDQKYHTRAKLMHKVFHDEKVSVKVCATETFEEIASVHYDLYAGVVHSGFSMDSGHYYTYAADASNKWYKFNDSVVTGSMSEELHNLKPPNTPYILFYQMGSRSNESVEASALTKVIKVDVPTPLKLEELPIELRDYVDHDNHAFTEELRSRHFKNTNAAALQSILKTRDNGSNGDSRGGSGDNGRNYFDDDDDQPPPASGCGGNALNINVNRFVY